MKNKETNCIHPLSDSNENSAATAPIFPSTAYDYTGQESLPYPGFFSTYNQERLADIVAKLEEGAYGLAFNSGMAAITSAVLSMVSEGDHIIFMKELFGGTWKFAEEELPQRGINCSFSGNTVPDFETCLKANTRLLYIESPSNPLLSIVDLEEISLLAKENGILTIIDNTFATPVNQQPLNSGIDIVIHSGTKYLGGHNDLPFGALVTNNEEYRDFILSTAKLYGGFLSPFNCYQAERSIKTLALRVERQNNNAFDLATYLEEHEKVKKVYYPGLKSHRDHETAKKQMTGFGGMISFELDCNPNDVSRFLSRLKIIKPALSLGGVESLICSPAKTSHSGLTKEQRAEMGISETLLRLSVGVEHIDDLKKDITDAF